MTFLPLFPLPFGGVYPLHASGAVRAVFPPVGFWEEERPEMCIRDSLFQFLRFGGHNAVKFGVLREVVYKRQDRGAIEQQALTLTGVRCV